MKDMFTVESWERLALIVNIAYRLTLNARICNNLLLCTLLILLSFKEIVDFCFCNVIKSLEIWCHPKLPIVKHPTFMTIFIYHCDIEVKAVEAYSSLDRLSSCCSSKDPLSRKTLISVRILQNWGEATVLIHSKMMMMLCCSSSRDKLSSPSIFACKISTYRFYEPRILTKYFARHFITAFWML